VWWWCVVVVVVRAPAGATAARGRPLADLQPPLGLTGGHRTSQVARQARSAIPKDMMPMTLGGGGVIGIAVVGGWGWVTSKRSARVVAGAGGPGAPASVKKGQPQHCIRRKLVAMGGNNHQPGENWSKSRR
jgi:hypothetical protein